MTWHGTPHPLCPTQCPLFPPHAPSVPPYALYSHPDPPLSHPMPFIPTPNPLPLPPRNYTSHQPPRPPLSPPLPTIGRQQASVTTATTNQKRRIAEGAWPSRAPPTAVALAAAARWWRRSGAVGSGPGREMKNRQLPPVRGRGEPGETLLSSGGGTR